MPKKTVCMLSCLHGLYDDRIYWKEALSLKKHGYNVIHLGVGEEEKDFISEHGIRLISIKRKRYFTNPFVDKIFRTITFRKNIYKNIFLKANELNANVYHIHDLQLNKIGSRLKNLNQQPKVIYDVHEDYGDMIRYYHHRKGLVKLLLSGYAYIIDYLEKRRTKKYDYYIHVTKEILEKFHNINPSVKSEIIFNYSELSPEIEDNSLNKNFDILYCGQISFNRGALELIEAVNILRENNSQIKALFLGDFNTSEFGISFNELISKLKLKTNIIHIPAIPHNEVSVYFKQSKIGICTLHPIKKFHDSIPIKIFEYMSFGLPIVASNFAYMEYYVNSSKTGITVDAKASAGIAKAIDKLLSDTKLYNSCSLAGTTAVIEKYNWQKMEDKLIPIYQEILNR